MRNDQGDIRGYRPQPTAPVPVVHPEEAQQPGYPPANQQQGYPPNPQPAAPPQQPMTGPYTPQGYTGMPYPPAPQQPMTGPYAPPQGYPQGMPPAQPQPTGPYNPQQGFLQNGPGMQPPQQHTGSYAPPQQPFTPQTTGSFAPQPAQPSLMEKVRAMIPQLDIEMIMLLAAAILGLAYALFVTISFSWLTRLIPHLIVIWLTVAANAAACVLRQKRLSLAACAGYVLSLLLFLNYFYLLLPQIALCVLAYLHKDE